MKGTIFFDIGNVLVKFSHEKMYDQVSRVTGLPLDIIMNFFIYQGYGEKYELGLVSESEIFEELLKKSRETFTKNDLVTAASDIFQENEKMLDLVSTLKDLGHKLILLSNTCYAHFHHKLKLMPIIQLFDEKILSFERKLRKPDPKIYQLALKMANGQKSFYTDDISEYVAAAKRSGLDGEVFRSADKLRYDLSERMFII